MDKEKFVGRVNNMVYSICGCNKEEGTEVLEECLKRVRNCKNFPKSIFRKPNKRSLKLTKFWANYVKTHPVSEWSREQNKIINFWIKNSKSTRCADRQFEKMILRKMRKK